MTIPSRRRNPILADIFNRLEYMERRGSGFKKILQSYAVFGDNSEAFALTTKKEPRLRFLFLEVTPERISKGYAYA